MQIHRELALLSSNHAKWTPEMCLSILRADSRFRLTVAGNVGLAEWDTVRVPTRREIVEQCIAEGGGKVSIAAVEDRMRALYGDAWDRVHMGAAANRIGGRLAGTTWCWRVGRRVERLAKAEAHTMRHHGSAGERFGSPPTLLPWPPANSVDAVSSAWTSPFSESRSAPLGAHQP